MQKNFRRDAWGSLLSHYRTIFGLAWKNRHNMKGRGYRIEESQFLPAALALQETPLSPAPRVTMWSLIAFTLIAVLWATFGQIDIVATAQGKIVPNERTKTIQSLETARVKAIHIQDGQVVKAGETLIELDATSAVADVKRVRTELAAARWQVARSQELLTAIETGKLAPFPQPPGADILNATTASQSQAQVEGMFVEYRSKLMQLNATIERSEAELQSTRELVHKLEKTLPLAKKREQDYQGLIKQGFVANHAYLEIKQNRIEQEADLAMQRSRTKEISANLREAIGQRSTLTAETRRVALDSIVDGQQKEDGFQQELIKAEARSKMMYLTAPVDGTVQQLATHTVGGVVTAAQALMMIVPQDDAIEIEAFIENKDIGFIHPGQNVQVKVETFSYTKYGTLPAVVTHIAQDATNDEKRGLIYAVRIKMKKSTMEIEGKKIHLTPGMSITAEIKTGKRSVVSYFLSPLIEYQKESLRER